jgi:hypothetical protein
MAYFCARSCCEGCLSSTRVVWILSQDEIFSKRICANCIFNNHHPEKISTDAVTSRYPLVASDLTDIPVMHYNDYRHFLLSDIETRVLAIYGCMQPDKSAQVCRKRLLTIEKNQRRRELEDELERRHLEFSIDSAMCKKLLASGRYSATSIALILEEKKFYRDHETFQDNAETLGIFQDGKAWSSRISTIPILKRLNDPMVTNKKIRILYQWALHHSADHLSTVPESLRYFVEGIWTLI